MKHLLTLTTLLTLALLPAAADAAFTPSQIDQEAGNSNGALFADLNNDGIDDLLVLKRGANAVYYRNQAGGFVLQPNHSLSESEHMSLSAVAADYDNDGVTDVFVAEYGADNALYHGTGNGNFEKIAEPFSNDPGFSKEVVWVDIDADADLDLVIGNSFGSVMVYVNQGNGTLVKDNDHQFAAARRMSHVLVIDMNGDSAPDVLFAGAGMSLFLNNGNGGYDRSPAFGTLNNVLIHDIAVADHNADGLPDVIALHGIRKQTVFVQQQDGQYVTEQLALEPRMYTRVGWIDFDGDNDADLIAIDVLGKAHGLYMNENGAYVLQAQSELSAIQSRLSAVVLHDVDADGDIDVYLTNPTNGANTLLTNLADYGRLVLDGNMEQPATGSWGSYGLQMYEKNVDAHTGLQSMHLLTLGSGGGFQQRGLAVHAGQWYKFGFYYKLVKGDFRVRLGIHTSNADFENKQFATTQPTGGWVYYERYFQIPDTFDSDFRLVFSVRDGDVFVDDVVIESTMAPSLIRDGNMDAAHTSYWLPYGVPDMLEKQDESGNRYLFVEHFNGSAGTFQNSISIEQGASYLLRYRYRFPVGERLRPVLNIRNISRQGDFEGIYKDLPHTAAGEWSWYQRQIVIPENAGSEMRLFFTMRSGANATGQFSLDDVTLESFASETLLDGDMEDPDLASWSDYGAIGTKQKVQDQSHAGLQALYIARAIGVEDNMGIQQTRLRVEPNTQYRLRFWYKSDTTIIPRLGNSDSNNDFESALVYLTPQSDWHEYERVFTTPAIINNTDFRFVLLVDRFSYEVPSVGPYEQMLVDADYTVFIDGVPTEGLGPEDINAIEPPNQHVWLDDVILEAL
ncbi:MAG: hypothetical protein COU35_03670 [Candidatus Magasanikbacteria bacterium CG10_big_fil_rev_8_21_14_0_10_47_10]|uniref:CBM-cenC domain-containing protein n=1 Tax=Candidatus Magasanikbacteria bacterium CG10_big_fil_rev_8_21_14_0_10_47_10 TaxID=1974652 RepID=A0A2H0TPX3_9BACT|nr:MAG: hypothetical protein COU35_03670 [Candidatus Magasanikbacteria bacterium CG10_big_fil_rev_8_21_14_0_10_47_10]